MHLKRLSIIRTDSVAFVERRPGWLVTNEQLAQERRIQLADDGSLPWADQLFSSFPWDELTAAPQQTLIARQPSDLQNVADELFPTADASLLEPQDGPELQVPPTTSVTRPEELGHMQPRDTAMRLPDGARGYYEERQSQEDDDYFRERGEVLERGVGTPGTRRSGRTHRVVPPEHATHATRTSHIARAHEPMADYHERQTLTPCFLSREVKDIGPEDDEHWAQADQREWEGIRRKRVMSIVRDTEPLPGESVLPSRMIHVEKAQYERSNPKHFKSRLCVQELKCIYQHSQDQTYSPTPTQEAGRLLTWFAATHRERIYSLDCVQAYLNTPAPSRKGQRIFVRFPKGHERPGCLMLLHRYLYGLQKAAQMWHRFLITALKDAGFRQLTTEPCILVHRGQGKATMVEVFVDDLRTIGDRGLVKNALDRRQIEITGDEVVRLHLGVEYDFTKQGIFTHQTKAALELLREYGYDSVHPAKVPLVEYEGMEPEFKTGVTKLEGRNMKSLVGSLLWLRRGTRPDLAVAISKLAKVPHDRPFEQQHRAHQILRYLAGTADFGILFRRDAGNRLELWPDAGHAGKTGRLSRAGYVITLGGTPIQWHTGTLTGVKRSTQHAEYGAAFRCAVDALALMNVIQDLEWDIPLNETILHEDNNGAISVMVSGPITKASKSFEIEQFALTEYVQQGKFRVEKVATNEQLGDLFTKGLRPQQFAPLVRKLLDKRSEVAQPPRVRFALHNSWYPAEEHEDYRSRDRTR